MCTQTGVDVRYTNLGLCEADQYKNHPTPAIKNPAIHNQCAVVRLQLHNTHQSTYTLRYYGDEQAIPPLPPTIGRPS
jgi:hypothetical protein